MSKYVIAGVITNVTISGAAYHIALSPDANYRISRVGRKNSDIVLFRPPRDDGRAEVAYFNGSIEIEVSTTNRHAASFYANRNTKAHWRFEFGPSKQHGDGMIWVCGMSVAGSLVRKPLNKNPNGLKITAIA